MSISHFDPKRASLWRCIKRAGRLLDHLVGAREQREQDFDGPGKKPLIQTIDPDNVRELFISGPSHAVVGQSAGGD
jgi:hypothetical protein